MKVNFRVHDALNADGKCFALVIEMETADARVTSREFALEDLEALAGALESWADSVRSCASHIEVRP